MKASAYITLEPVWDRDELIGVKIARVTQQRPRTGPPGARVLKVTLDVPPEAFMTREVEVRVPVGAPEFGVALDPHMTHQGDM